MHQSPAAIAGDCYTPNRLLSVAQAQTQILHCTQPLTAVERTALRASLGRVLAHDVMVRMDVPSQRNSAMDGYAFRHIDTDVHAQLSVVDSVFAGHPSNRQLDIGQCVRIMTGAMLPDDADTVVMQEHVSREGDSITLQKLPKPGANVRHPGEDLRKGAVLLPAGRVINAADLGVLASQGIAEINVLRRPRVAFFSTGDELRSLGETLRDGDLYDSNRYTLYGLLAKLPVDMIDMGTIPDQPLAIRQAFADAAQLADVVITSGGASVGDADYVASILQAMGQVHFWKLAIKPGKPLAFGQLTERCLFFGLPGNPVAVMVTFLVFVRAALLRLRGQTVTDLPVYSAITRTPLKKAAGRQDYQRGICRVNAQGQWHVSSSGAQGSHILSSMSTANCLIVLPPDTTQVEVGECVNIIPFDTIL